MKLATNPKANKMTRCSLYACRNARSQRWGQAIVNNFGIKGDLSDKLFYLEDEDKVAAIVESMIAEYQLADK